MTEYKIREHAYQHLRPMNHESIEIVAATVEKIQAAILFEINGFSKEASQKGGKEYQGDLSDRILDVVAAGFRQQLKITKQQIMDYQKTLVPIAKDNMYIRECTGSDYGDAWYETKLNPYNPAKDILEKYQVILEKEEPK